MPINGHLKLKVLVLDRPVTDSVIRSACFIVRQLSVGGLQCSVVLFLVSGRGQGEGGAESLVVM